MTKEHHSGKNGLSEIVAFFAPLLTIFMHIFCCGLPILFAILSSVFDIYLTIPFLQENANTEFYVLIFSAALLCISYVLYFNRKECCHTHKRRKFYNKIVLIIATIIFFISIFIHFVDHN